MKMETPKRGSILEVSRSEGLDKHLNICKEHIQGQPEATQLTTDLEALPAVARGHLTLGSKHQA